MSQMQENENQFDEAENMFNEGFGLSENDEAQDMGNQETDGETEQPVEESASEPVQNAMPDPDPVPVSQKPVYEPAPQSMPQAEPAPVRTIDVPEEIADELETLKTLNPAAAELALEDSPEGASVRSRLEQYGAELAQDRAEQVLYRRGQEQAAHNAEMARYRQAQEAHNARFKAMFEQEHTEYAAMLFDPSRKAEAVQYQQDVFNWIAAKPYSEAAQLMEIARNGRDPQQVSALLTRFERERSSGRKQPDPTGALAVPGRGAPVAPSGIGDKDDFDAGWNANQ